MTGYADRGQAGRILADRLVDAGLGGVPDTVVLGLPRGGVIVAAQVASRLGVEVDVLVVRKLGVPGQEELAFGAVAGGGVQVLNPDVVAAAGVGREVIDRVSAHERVELDRRERAYRGARAPQNLLDRTVILVDDGLATGATMRAAIEVARATGARRIVVAVPVAPPEVVTMLQAVEGVEVVCPLMPHDFGGVGRFYGDFEQTSDDEVRAVLSAP